MVVVISPIGPPGRGNKHRQGHQRKERKKWAKENTFVLLVGVDASGSREGGKSLEGVEERGDTDDPEPLGEETCGKGGPANEIEHDDEGEEVNGWEGGEGNER